MVSYDFSDRVVLVTGACGGIGMATAKAFAAGRARLMLADLREADPAAIDLLLQTGASEVRTCVCNMGQESDVSALVQTTLDRFDRIDVIVNIAGAMIYRSVADMSAEDWRSMLAVNLVGPSLLTGAGLKYMKPGGAIINVASIHARQTTADVAGYAAAKAGLCSVTRTAAIEGKSKGIRANAILPGAIDTPMLWNSPTIKSGAEKLEPEDVGKAEDIAATACFLASEAASFISGTEFLVDGGRLARL